MMARFDPPSNIRSISGLFVRSRRVLSSWFEDSEPSLSQIARTVDIRVLLNFSDFKDALTFTNQVGEIAEQQGNHPAILTEWGRVSVIYWTHIIGGLHKNDFIMAAKTNKLYGNQEENDE